ncbi:response regulator receiver domain protein [Rhodopseudomonas palustris HaA2]|uniref:Response regulator receiver domain protein n=1 Tax=Rhodopseudomonas palustris (strain HaA2) TaxID=316058 RepID=Q2J2V2_RHOP2|nr:response regulator [Rhodopseudomonas palustris]ABD05208.1 response regulator receiver domain protein [Rhodopseudomonas palustris HaA2]
MASIHPPIRVLVVEDEMFIRMDVVEFLRAAGVDVVEAISAAEGIRLLERDPDIRLMFTDIDMPGAMNGLKLAAAVRERWPPIKIIATSGHFKLQAGDLPPDALFFLKPYQPAEIIDAVRRLTYAA